MESRIRESYPFLSLIMCIVCIAWSLFTPAPAAGASPVEIAVHNLTGDALRNVEEALVLPPGLVREDGTVNRPWLDYFVRQIPAKVREALKPFGYYKSGVAVTETRTEETLRINVDVSPGKPVAVSSAEIRIEGPGAAEKALSDLAAKFPLKKGDVLRQDTYEAAKENLRARALDLGYLDARFTAHSISLFLAADEAEIRLVLSTGPRYRFGAITFSGAPSYPDPFLRRYLAFRAGDVFSTKKIGETQLNLRNADRFGDVSVKADREHAEGNVIPVAIRLTPKPAKRFKAGVGYMTDIGPRGSLQYKDVNILDRGHEFNSELTVSERLQALASNYIVPGTKDAKSYTALNLKLQREDVSTYVTKSASLELAKTRSFEKGRLGTAFVTALAENSTAGEETTNTFSLYPGLRFSERHYDNLKRPGRGYYYQAETRGTHQVIGSDTGFVQLILEGNTLIPLPGRFSVFTRLKVAGTLQNEPVRDLPIPLRFFAGGDRSVRGYSYQSLGPKDDSGDVVGGKNLFVASIQIERALGKDWGVLAFYDTGNAFNDFSRMDLAQGVGVGIRYYTPVGPIELDVARQIGVADPGYRVHVSIGFAL